MDVVLIIVGVAALLGAGDALVRGAVALSLRIGVPALIVSLTVVAFGTSAPELLIGLQAAFQDAHGIVYGNVVGSNIANVLLVVGLPAVISSIDPRECDTGKEWLMMIAGSAVFIALCFAGPLIWWHGAILLAGLAYMLGDAFRGARAARGARSAEDLLELEEIDPHMAPWKIGALLAVGVVGLPLGAHFLIEGARGVAASAGLSEAAVGLTIVAIGTSLPELVTAVMAAIRRHADVVLGNVIGSNLFNVLGIMGVVSFAGPLPVPREFLTLDLWVMLASSLALWPFVFGGQRIGRPVGAAFLAAYLLFTYVVLGSRM